MGNVYHTVLDYRSRSPFGPLIRRSYNSIIDQASLFGYGWSSNLDRRVVVQPNYTPPGGTGSYTRLSVYRPDGRVFNFKEGSNGSITPETPSDLGSVSVVSSSGTSPGFGIYLVGGVTTGGSTSSSSLTAPGNLRYLATNGITEIYSPNGQLLGTVRQDGLTRTYQYNASGQLTGVTGPYGHKLTLTYSSAGYVSSITDPDGGVYHYSYDASGNLTGVTDPDGRSSTYQYGDGSYPHALTAVLNNDGTPRYSWTYDSQGRAVQYALAGGLRTISITYNSNGTADITDSSGATRQVTFTTTSGVVRFASASKPGVGIVDGTRSMTYDSNGYPASSTDMDGNVTTYHYLSDGLQASRTQAFGMSLARTISTTWNAALRLPTNVTDGVQDKAFTYDAQGQLTAMKVTSVATGTARTTRYAYGSNGLVSTITGPRTDLTQTTTLTYDSSGDVASITDAAGHTTQLTAYNANGDPLTIVDPNGVTTQITYDPMQRITSITRASATIDFSYDTNGWLSELTLPNGATYTYGHDAAGRVTSITDADGNQVVYTRDGYGRITRRQYLNAAGSVTQTQSRTYNALEQLASVVGSAGQTRTYSQDANGNLTGYTDANQHAWSLAYDALNRLVTITRPDSATLSYAYDSRNDLTQFTDPRGQVTSYVYNGFDEPTQRTSPDTGATSYTYDSAGDLATRTDANGVTRTYSYDALDRLTGIAYSGGSLPAGGGNATFSYDQGTDGIGHLTGYANSTASTTLGYDAYGDVTHKAITLDGQTLNVGYTYDLAGNVTRMTYPDGMTVTYTRDAAGRVTGVSATIGGQSQTLASSVSWQPAGALASLTFANGLSAAYGYTQDGWLSSLTLGNGTTQAVNDSFSQDAVGNITGITDNLNSAYSETFGYDPLNRLTSATGAYGALGYAYDANGNRTGKTTGSATESYAYATNSNQLLNTSGTTAASYQYDADGNVISDGTHTYQYARTGRLIGVDGLDAYGYNALGERVVKQVTSSKSGKTTTTLFVYGKSRHLIAEYAANGTMQKAYIWVDNRPVALVTPGGVYYIQTDQRGAPRTITNASGTVVSTFPHHQ